MMDIVFVYGVFSILGLLIGSFLNVCIYRIPRTHFTLTAESLASLQEAGVPDEILDTLVPLQDQEYVTEGVFFETLEQTLGHEALMRHEAALFRCASKKRESIVFPGSHCPVCQTPIKPWDNVPVFSFLILGGKCRACGSKISWRYPLVEALTCALLLLLLHRFGFTLATGIYFVFVAALIVISFVDIDHLIIPDSISIPGIVFGIAASLLLEIPWFHAVLGAAVGGGAIAILVYVGPLIFKQETMGLGDVKLMAMIGAFLGWRLALLTILLGALLGTIVGLTAIALKKTTLKSYLPFGPFLCTGACIALLWGHQLMRWYWGLFLPSG